jgi:hypothetical protein
VAERWLDASKGHGEHFTETKSKTRSDFNPSLYRAHNLFEQFFNKIKNVGVWQPDTTSSQSAGWVERLVRRSSQSVGGSDTHQSTFVNG